jgi:hypothetical protein
MMDDIKVAIGSSAGSPALELHWGRGNEEQFISRGFGKWSQRGVPHRGWTCIAMEDQGDDWKLCEMCEHVDVRFIHVMTHPDFDGDLRVGCICAGNMEQDVAGAELREKVWRRSQNPEIAAALTWVEGADKILERGGLNPAEERFINDMRRRAVHDAQPRIRKRHRFSAKQMNWFRAIYLRVVGK